MMVEVMNEIKKEEEKNVMIEDMKRNEGKWK